jgi:hypothetical protein
MVDFMRKLSWDKGCPGSWPTLSLGISGRHFQKRLTSEAADLVKKNELTSVGVYHQTL